MRAHQRGVCREHQYTVSLQPGQIRINGIHARIRRPLFYGIAHAALERTRMIHQQQGKPSVPFRVSEQGMLSSQKMTKVVFETFPGCGVLGPGTLHTHSRGILRFLQGPFGKFHFAAEGFGVVDGFGSKKFSLGLSTVHPEP